MFNIIPKDLTCKGRLQLTCNSQVWLQHAVSSELATCRRKVEEMLPYVGCSRNMSPYLVHCRGEPTRFLNDLKISP